MKIIVGPVTKEYIEIRKIPGAEFISINTKEDCDIHYSPGDSIFDIIKKLPKNWHPDYFIFLYPEHNLLPKEIENAPFITVAIICDWNIKFHIIKEIINIFDVILTDKQGANLFKILGHKQVFYWSINSFNPKIHKKLPNIKKIYDVVFVGNLNPIVQRERKFWIKRLAKLSNKYKIKICGGIYGEEYAKLLNKAKIVFNRSIRGEMNCRVYETLACGSLLFMEEENKEIKDILTPFKHYIPYNKENLEKLVEYYITHKKIRKKIIIEGYKKIQEENPKEQWQRLLNIIGKCKKIKNNNYYSQVYYYIIRTEQAMNCEIMNNFDFNYIINYVDKEFNEAYKFNKKNSRLNNDMGVIYILTGKKDLGIKFLINAITLNPDYIISWCSLAEILKEKNRFDNAKRILDYIIKLLEKKNLYIDNFYGLFYPWGSTEFKVKYESIGYFYIDDLDKQIEEYKKLCLWQCYNIYGDIFSFEGKYEEAIYYYTKAINIGLDLSTPIYKLAKIYEISNKYFNAIEIYKNYLEYEPLDFKSALSLCNLLYKTKNFDELKTIVNEYITIGRAFPEFNKYKNKFMNYAKN